MDESVTLNEELIKAAEKQDPEAINKIFSYFEGYINQKLQGTRPEQRAEKKLFIQATLLKMITSEWPKQKDILLNKSEP